MKTRIILNSFEVSAFAVSIKPSAANAEAVAVLNRLRNRFRARHAASSWRSDCRLCDKPGNYYFPSSLDCLTKPGSIKL